MVHKVVFLNGPPASGKDAAAAALSRRYGARIYEMKRPMRDALMGLFGMDLPLYNKHFIDRAKKDAPNQLMFGKTPREVLISMSEQWIKPLFGEGALGQLAVRRMSLACASWMTAIPDSGFVQEALPIVAWAGAENCLLLRIHRDGCTFENDSRGYIDLEHVGVKCIDIENRFELDMYGIQIVTAVKDAFDVRDEVRVDEGVRTKGRGSRS